MANPIQDQATAVADALDNAVENCIRKVQHKNIRLWHSLNSKHTYYELMSMKDGQFYGQLNEVVINSSKIHKQGWSAGGTYRGIAYSTGLSALQSGMKSGLNQLSGPLGLISAGPCTLVSAGGVGAVIAPWMTAASILWDYRGDINASNLHDLIANQNYPCHCSANQPDEPKDCDHSIKWILARKEANLALNACSIFLAGLPATVQLVYRLGRERKKRAQWVGQGETRYPCPDEQAVWNENTQKCEICTSLFKSKFLIGKKGQRHHCRLCGKCCCGKCCFYRATLNDPLTSRDKSPNPQRGHAYDEKKTVGGQLVCTECLAGIREQMSTGFQSYQTGPERMAQNLTDNATPKKKSILGCIRAQAAIFTLAKGDIKKMLASLIAADGVTAVVRWSKTGVTKLPF